MKRKISIADMMKLGSANMIKATISSVSSPAIFTKFGRQGRVATVILKDKTGEIDMPLFDEQIETVKEGESVRIYGCYVKEWKGKPQLHLLRGGGIEKIS